MRTIERAPTATNGQFRKLERFPTGVPGLDEVLRGGLIRGGIYLLGGPPGAGKTTLANQVAHDHARRGGRSIIATLLSETHERMLTHLSGFTFFGAELIGEHVQYLSIYDELVQSGLDGTLDMLRRLVREQRATFLAIDGASVFADFAESETAYKRFAYQLHAQLAALGCTSVLLTEVSTDMEPIGTHVDGIIALEDATVNVRDVRLLHVKKLRGTSFIGGRHQFTITRDGVEIYPRLEASVPMTPPTIPDTQEREPFGVSELDGMLSGGAPRGSSTLTIGAPGAGKTVTGLHFIAEGARRGERGLIVGFHETPARLISKARSLGLDLSAGDGGLTTIKWYPPLELLLDGWAREVLRTVDEIGAQRVFIDAVSDVQRLIPSPDRVASFFAALTNELRSRGVTSLFAQEQADMFGGGIEEVQALSATVDNTIILRYVELRSQLHRLISVVKMRESDFDGAIREFRITQAGLQVDQTFDSAEALLTGFGRTVA